MKQNQMSDMHRCNKTVVTTYTIIVLVLVAAYAVEVIKGSRTIGYYIVFCLLALLPNILCIVLYKKNPESSSVKHILTVGFSIFYLYTIFTTISPVAYTYALLVAIALLCYNEVKLVFGYMICVCVGNIAQVVVLAIQGGVSSEDMPNVEIRLISLMLYAVFIYMATKVVKQNNEGKLKQIEEEKKRTEVLMQQIMDVSQRLTQDIQVVAGKMEVLETSADKTRNSMEEVAQGTGEAVDTIQVQMEQTEEIQRTVKEVAQASEAIEEHVDSTSTELDAAQKNMDDLLAHVKMSNDANGDVSKALDELYIYANQMQSIVGMINEVTEQTSLLSLNASIEAARAGEAGRGFAVVASEISSLATQTQQATVDITNLIENVSRELSSVVRVIEQMISNVEEQNVVARNTAQSFSKISAKNQQVAQKTQDMKELVVELQEANEVIMKGIETISAVTEEVTAHANVTLESTEENAGITNEVGDIVEGLNQLAQELQVTE